MSQDPASQFKPTPVRVTASHRLGTGLAVLLAVCWLVAGCNKPQVEEAPVSPPAEVAQPAQLSKVSPPKLDEVHEAVKRVFKDAAVIDTSRNPNFVAGDFNGDLSQDLAVILKVAPGKIAQMNEEFPAWILRDPFAPPRLGVPPPGVKENEVLLAVIHGYGSNHWRDPQATQTYLLRNAVGSDMKVHSGKEFVAANRDKKLPRLHGDLLGEVLRGSPGYLYYAETTYSWYDPKNFKGEPERRLVHAPRAVKNEQ